MRTISSGRSAFADLAGALFPEPDRVGVKLRLLEPPAGPALTVAYIAGLVAPGDLERLVLAPLARGFPGGPPEALARSGRLPAPELRVAADAGELEDGLLAGEVAVHLDGYPGALLVGAGPAGQTEAAFGTGLAANVALLRRLLPGPGLRTEVLAAPGGGMAAVIHLDRVAATGVVQAVRDWARQQRPGRSTISPWRALVGVFRLPPAVECPAPAAVAAALRRGYVAVLADHIPDALLAPTTLELLFEGPHDVTLAPALRRLVTWPRLAATLVILWLKAGFIAISSYHHALLPGPFLMALASARQNPALPYVMEVLVAAVISDALWTAAVRLGGRRWQILATIAMALAAMAALQAGVLAPVPAMLAITAAVAIQVLPCPALGRAARLWRYLFIGAAAGLGIYGMALLSFALMVYLGEERPFGHPLRRPPAAVR